MKMDDIIQEYRLREPKESSLVRPEGIPARLLHQFTDHHEVKAFTNDDNSVWLLVSKAEGKFILQAPLQ
jgi:hypothetical protein